MANTKANNVPRGIAVIGMSGRFPGANNLDDFWRNLCAGVESTSSFTNEELEASGINPAFLSSPNYIKSGMILDEVESFDASFFGYTPREAELMDPQHRLFLECAWEALEHAGYDTERYKGWIGVFGGATLDGYLLYNLLPNPEIRELMGTTGNVQVGTANETDYLTTRISYKLGLKGPSVNVQSACSTSLLATHLACQSLLNYQCDIALAGGVAVRIPQKDGYWFQEGGVRSPDGHCRTFDAAASGTVFSSGMGMVVLKRLADAINDGDYIHAVIRGTAANNDGSAKVGYTAPSVEGQAEVIAMAHHVAGIDPEQISYVEAHGTATTLGDPIEITALTQAFRVGTDKKGYCAIGSVKTNIGHTGTAAGVAGLIKTVLALKHRQLPPSLHFETPNPKIDFANSPFYVNTSLAEWKTDGSPLLAGVSAFGIGGTNAHAIVEEALPRPQPSQSRPWQLLVLSAKTSSALETATANLTAYLKQQPEADFADIAYTLQVGRRGFNHRRVLVCQDRDDALNALETRDPKRLQTLFRKPQERSVAFMFSGQGSQYVDMGLGLYQTEPLLREHVDRCAEILEPHLGLDIRDVLYPDEEEERGRGGEGENGTSPISNLKSPINQTQYTQPALFVIEYALAQLWMSWGAKPQAMIGHSIGEYVAACLAGVFSLEDALALVAARGRLMQSLPAGAMLMVPLPEQEVAALLGEWLSLAAVNAPSRCVVAGPTEAVEELKRRLGERGIDCRRLHTSHAFHSAMMDPIVEPFTELVRQVTMAPPTIAYVSNVTGTWITPEQAQDPTYWARHLRGAVRFADGVRELTKGDDLILLEVGPGQALTTLARQHPNRAAGQVVLPSLRHPQEQQPDLAFLLGTLGQLWLAGLPIDWAGFYAHERRLRVPLPTYPFERRKYWIAPPRYAELQQPKTISLHKKTDPADWFYIPAWKQSNPPIWSAEALGREPQRWLVFLDAAGVGAGLARQLERAGQEVVTVAVGEQFERLGERAYALNPRRPEEYDGLFSELRELNRVPQTIAHLWSVGADDEQRAGEEFLERSQALGFYSLIYLAQALGRQNITSPLHLGVVSSSTHKVAGEAALYPEKATLLGPCRVIPAEYPNISCQSIDILPPGAGSAAEEELADQLIGELAARSTDGLVAYRSYDRWVQTYEAARLGEAIEERLRVRQRGVYLITGGLGGIGLVLAEYLARVAQARLVLTGRSAFPERAAWDEWLATHDVQDRVSQNIRKLRELEALGAEVLVISADVADERQMRAAMGQVYERFGTLHGVIHSAGVAGGGLIQLKTADVAARVLAPKVNAVRTLETILAEAPLDFMVLCSSTTALIGGVGQVDYCGANAFMDAYAHFSTSRRGIFTVSINWEAWEEVGMAVNAAAAYGRRQNGQAQPAREVGHPLLERCIHETASQAVYTTEFSVAKHWVLAEHKIMGNAVVPGTTYLEMARAAFADRFKEAGAEIGDVFFMTPLMVGESERREARVTLEGSGDVVSFRVQSRPIVENGHAPRWQDHVRGTLGRLAEKAPKQLDLAAIVGRQTTEKQITAEDFEQAERLVFWGPRWRSLRKVYIGENEGLGLVELPDEFRGDLPDYGMHPATLDVATAFANNLVGEGAAYLPLSYERLKVKGALPQRIYSYVRYREEPNSKKETITFDITLTDEQGRELVDIAGFTMRRVGESGLRIIESTGAEHQAPEPVANGVEHEQESLGEGEGIEAAPKQMPTVSGLLPKEGVDAFMRILSRHRLPQIAVSSRDLHGVIERARSIGQSRVVEEMDKAQQLRSTHARPNVQTAYEAPRNETEERIADVWRRVLGIEEIGIHDNFFELGGDSVLAVQIIAKSTEAGFQFTPAQLFEYQTVAELAALVSPAKQPAAEQETGPVPLVPAQRWIFEAGDARRWTQALLLEASEPLNPELLKTAVAHLIAHHDALRLRFHREPDGWHAICVPPDLAATPNFEVVDLAGLAAEVQEEAIAASGAQADIDLTADPLLRGLWFERGAALGRLLLATHRLAVDTTSWSILLEDLLTAYRQLERGAQVALPPRTVSFGQWAERLRAYAGSEQLRDEAPRWHELAALPLAKLAPDHRNGSADGDYRIYVTLDQEATEALLNQVPPIYQTDVSEVLLTALAQALGQEAGEGALLIDIEGNGRAELFADVNPSRIVGPLAARYPARLDLTGIWDPGVALKAAKEQLRAVPNQGIGYGLLRYLAGGEDAALPSAEIGFSYQGPLEQMLPPAAPLRALTQTPEAEGERLHALEVRGLIADGQLRLEWVSSVAYDRATIERLAEQSMIALRELIAHCLSPEAGGYTPSDFPDIDLSQDELDKLLTKIGE